MFQPINSTVLIVINTHLMNYYKTDQTEKVITILLLLFSDTL
jgi:hypothetical protein